MASSSKRPRSEDDEEEEEETHLQKHKFDLNKEPEPEEEEAQVDEDANQNEEHIEEEDESVKAALALSHIMFLRNITQDGNQQMVKSEEEDQETEQKKPLDSVLWLDEEEKQRWIKIKKPEADKEAWIKKMKLISKYKEEKDDSGATLSLLRRWNIPAIPPVKIVKPDMIEQCSEPIRKQMTREDEKQSRLRLSKSQVTKKFLPLLEKAKIQQEKEGIRVSVYGPDGKVHEMKMWTDEKKNKLDLTFGWRKFVEDYELEEDCDFITIWMFRHKQSHEICLAIDRTILSFRKQVSKRISKAVFDDSD